MQNNSLVGNQRNESMINTVTGFSDNLKLAKQKTSKNESMQKIKMIERRLRNESIYSYRGVTEK